MIGVWMVVGMAAAADLPTPACRNPQRPAQSWFDEPNQDPWPGLTIGTDTAAWNRLVRTLEQGRLPAPGAVRPEELVQALDIDEAPPRGSEELTVRVEVARSPWEADAAVVRATLTARRGNSLDRPAAHVALVMDQDAQTVETMIVARQALAALVEGMRHDDTVTVVGSRTGVMLPATEAANLGVITEAIGALQPGGHGGLPEALALAYQQVQDTPASDLRRVILVSDGDIELIERASEMARLASLNSAQGIGLVGLGYGDDHGRDDSVEAMVQAAGGPILHLAYPFDGTQIADHIGAVLEPASRDIRILVDWDSTQVAGVHRVGNHLDRLSGLGPVGEQVGGELGVGQTATVLYEVRLRPGATGDLGKVIVRDTPPGQGMRERHAAVPAAEVAFEDASDDLRISVAAASLGELLSGQQDLERVSAVRVATLASAAARPEYARDRQLVALADQVAVLLVEDQGCSRR